MATLLLVHTRQFNSLYNLPMFWKNSCTSKAIYVRVTFGDGDWYWPGAGGASSFEHICFYTRIIVFKFESVVYVLCSEIKF